MKKTAHYFLLPLIATVFAIFSPLNAQTDPEYFPLQKGNYWIYRGETKYLVPKKGTPPNSGENEPTSEILTWKMEVVDTITRQNLFAALIKGMPYDLSWYEPGKPRGDYLILRAGTASYFLFSGETALAAWATIKDVKATLPDLDEKGELILDAPLVTGKVFGGNLGNYASGRYCWLVEGERSFDPNPFPAACSFKNLHSFTLAYHTGPDHQYLEFVPGIGITGYIYGHHGTLSETDLKLIEFGTANPSK